MFSQAGQRFSGSVAMEEKYFLLTDFVSNAVSTIMIGILCVPFMSLKSDELKKNPCLPRLSTWISNCHTNPLPQFPRPIDCAFLDFTRWLYCRPGMIPKTLSVWKIPTHWELTNNIGFYREVKGSSIWGIFAEIDEGEQAFNDAPKHPKQLKIDSHKLCFQSSTTRSSLGGELLKANYWALNCSKYLQSQLLLSVIKSFVWRRKTFHLSFKFNERVSFAFVYVHV